MRKPRKSLVISAVVTGFAVAASVGYAVAPEVVEASLALIGEVFDALPVETGE